MLFGPLSFLSQHTDLRIQPGYFLLVLTLLVVPLLSHSLAVPDSSLELPDPSSQLSYLHLIICMFSDRYLPVFLLPLHISIYSLKLALQFADLSLQGLLLALTLLIEQTQFSELLLGFGEF